jgi:hypothetical protein
MCEKIKGIRCGHEDSKKVKKSAWESRMFLETFLLSARIDIARQLDVKYLKLE